MKRGCNGGGTMDTPRPAASRHPLQYFPRLGPDNHRITSPAVREYNCVAWAAGIEIKTYGRVAQKGCWPSRRSPGRRVSETTNRLWRSWRTLKASNTPCATVPEFEEGYLKIAIFVKDDYPTHTCRQLPSQKWTSKMGFDGVDIEHYDLESISGDQYGTASVFMKRPTTIDR